MITLTKKPHHFGQTFPTAPAVSKAPENAAPSLQPTQDTYTPTNNTALMFGKESARPSWIRRTAIGTTAAALLGLGSPVLTACSSSDTPEKSKTSASQAANPSNTSDGKNIVSTVERLTKGYESNWQGGANAKKAMEETMNFAKWYKKDAPAAAQADALTLYQQEGGLRAIGDSYSDSLQAGLTVLRMLAKDNPELSSQLNKADQLAKGESENTLHVGEHKFTNQPGVEKDAVNNTVTFYIPKSRVEGHSATEIAAAIAEAVQLAAQGKISNA